VSRVAKKFRLLRRHPDGSTVHECTDESGYETLTTGPDGSRSTHMLEGICGDCFTGRHARADCPRRDRDTAVPHHPDEVDHVDDGVQDALPVREVEVFESPAPAGLPPSPRPKPRRVRHREPKPLSELVKTSAFMIARWVAGAGNPVPLRRLCPGRNIRPDDEDLAYAIAMQWVVINDDLIDAGPVDPRPLATYAIPN
jgi:hypothetical protein